MFEDAIDDYIEDLMETHEEKMRELRKLREQAASQEEIDEVERLISQEEDVFSKRMDEAPYLLF